MPSLSGNDSFFLRYLEHLNVSKFSVLFFPSHLRRAQNPFRSSRRIDRNGFVYMYAS